MKYVFLKFAASTRSAKYTLRFGFVRLVCSALASPLTTASCVPPVNLHSYPPPKVKLLLTSVPPKIHISSERSIGNVEICRA